MTISIEYLASVFATVIRQTSPILLVALCAGVCSKVKVFNIALEGTLLISAFFAFLTQYFVRNIWLSVLVAMAVAMLTTFIMSFFIVKLKGQPMIVGMAINTFALGFTTFLLSMVFNTKGTVTDPTLKGLPKITLPVIKDIPVVSTMFSSLTIIDYAAFVLAVVMYVIMYKTVIGFRLRAIGVNKSAASSLGVNVERYQIVATTLSGSMIGLAGCLLSLGSVTLFIQNISAARGYVALAANNLCQGHPLGCLLSSALFGFTKALAQVLQNTAIKQQLLECIPYIATIVAMAVYNAIAKRRAKGLRR
ncbi:MAG: ABC transporter permease [Aristaeellaceae bacterium]